MLYRNLEDPPCSGDEGDLADGGGEGGEEFLCKLLQSLTQP
jgi:hypothetical protein